MRKTALLLLLLLMPALNAFSQQTERLKVGLVLGGGGAKGAAEVGVLKAIEESGIPIDYIAGTSIGSIIGGLYAVGYRSADLDTLFRSQEWLGLLMDQKEEFKDELFKQEDGVTYVLGIPIYRSKNSKNKKGESGFQFPDLANIGAVRGDNIVALLNSMVKQPDSINFDSLPIPFRCVAVDVKQMSEKVLSQGNLPLCMRASMAIPGMFKPVKMGEQVLVDGGVMNNLPVDVVRAMGADVVIAVDLTQNKRENKDVEYSTGTQGRVLGMVEWFLSRPDRTKYNENRTQADVYINPDLGTYDVMSFSNAAVADMISMGERAGKQALPELKLLHKRVLQGK